MTQVPTEADIDAMSQEELDAYLSRAVERDSALLAQVRREDQGPGWLRRSGAPRSYAWTLIICAAAGIYASWHLLTAQIQLLKNPLADLTCDVNPLVACGDSLNAWQGNLLGVPNSLIGAMAFAVLACLGALLASGLRLPRWAWWGLSAGSLGGVAFIAWFLWVSVVAFGKLCPYCMVIWAATIPVAATTWCWAALGGHLGLGAERAADLVRMRWWITGAMYLAVILVIVVAFWDQWLALLR
ncbi:vitamin K epoxide reductase family protein [Actinomyces capricornis]|uniref:Membrane protein n=1 Tax=Actinomyces capricornis TaxID=2755559 RepID=A0ABM7UDP0_9ACTO|nr:vitamin K epoxide reductase family protein [Actinomyces capricornis]BDA65275.1 membrane protein [Actinomyces capricornis]